MSAPNTALRCSTERTTEPKVSIKPTSHAIATAFQRQTLAAFASDSGHPFDTKYFSFAAVDGTKVIGTVDGYTLYDWSYVSFLAVDPNHRGRGIGSQLLERAEMDARAAGLVGVQIDTFRYQAPALYRTRGYVEQMTLKGSTPDLDRIYFELRFSGGA